MTLEALSLAWLHKKGRASLNGAGVVPIPGTGNPAHMEENVKAVPLSYTLTEEDMQAIERCVPKAAMAGVPRYGGNFANKVFSVENNISLEEWKRKGNQAPRPRLRLNITSIRQNAAQACVGATRQRGGHGLTSSTS